MPRAGKELMENEEVYRMGDDTDYYKDVNEEITGGVGGLEEWIKMKRGYAAGGRVGMWEGGSLDYLDLIGDELSGDEWEGILQALGVYDERFLDYKKGGRVGRWMGGPLSAGKSTLREMLRHFSKGSSHGKSGAEMLKMVNPKQFSRHLEDPNLLFMKGSSKEGMMATDMVKDMVTKVEGERAMMINELLEAAKNIRKADKSIEQYTMEMIEAMMAKGADRQTAENLAKMVSGMAEGAAGKKPTPKLTDEGILQLENIYKNLITKDRSLNADGGRVGMFRGGIPKGLAAALRSIMGKYGDDAITTADRAPQPEKTIQEQIMDFDARNPNPNKQMTDEEIREFADEFGLDPTAEGFNWDGTLADARRLLKESEDETKYMYQQYKAGKLGKATETQFTETVQVWEDPVKIKAAVDDIFPTGDYKYDAQMAAEALVENNPKDFGNRLFDDLDDRTRMKVYNAVLTEIQSNMAKMRELKKLSKPTKTLESIEETGTINISDDAVAEEFTRFMKESDPEGYAKIQKLVDDTNQKLELKRFKTKGRKGNADGGMIDLTAIKIPDISQSGVESLFKRR